jgi:hypothetical protein
MAMRGGSYGKMTLQLKVSAATPAIARCAAIDSGSDS